VCECVFCRLGLGGEAEDLELVEKVRPGSSGSRDYMGMRRVENVEEPEEPRMRSLPGP
jgi:hypothetical protein